MKKLVLVLVSMFALINATWADDDKPIKVTDMPQAAQAFIKQHFPNSSVALAKMEKDFFDRSYDVIFTDGNKVDFNRKGEWMEVDCRYTQVPEAIIPAPIKTYINDQYPDAKIIGIEKNDRGGYEAKISKGWELTFDKKFNVIDIDD